MQQHKPNKAYNLQGLLQYTTIIIINNGMQYTTSESIISTKCIVSIVTHNFGCFFLVMLRRKVTLAVCTSGCRLFQILGPKG